MPYLSTMQKLYHFYLKINNYNEIDHKIKYNFKYIVSNSILNNLGSKFYFSGLFFSIKYNSLELGLSKIILSGGYPDIVWTSNEARFALFTNRKIKYWDKTNDVYLKYTSNKSKFITFIQLGLPNSLFSVRELDIFSRKNIGSIMGLRKYDAFEINGLIFGIEYTRLLQGKFFDISPTPNWYQNAKYDFSSFEGRRWAAHSGTDSDDLLVYRV